MKAGAASPGGRRLARWLLAGGCAAALALLALRRPWLRISSNLLDLIPASETEPELALIRGLATDRQSRVVLIALDGPPAGLDAAAAAAAGALTASGEFEEVARMDEGSFASAGRAIFERRLDLLLPGWLRERREEYRRSGQGAPWAAWLAERTAVRLEAFLGTPEALGFQDLIARDPLLLLPDLAGRLQGMADLRAEPSPDRRLVWALARGDVLARGTQQAVAAALDGAAAAAGRAAPGSRLRWTGVVRLASRSRAEIQSEISRLNLLSLAAVLLVTVGCVRHPLRALLLAPVLAVAMLGAWTAVMLVFARVHVLVFVIGSLLCGVAIDYGFYIFLQPPRYPGEPYREKLGRLLRPLLSSSLTMVFGFFLLVASRLPLIREAGVFIGAGLTTALFASIAWFAQLKNPFLETRAF
ncbi:MAG TPA: MMPL family transporter, partial [Opitutaceae bacterium]|nr:MMPL family transporter [Opitutaceae bacterium]